MKVTVHVETKTLVRCLLVLCGFVVSLLLLWKLGPVLILIGVAMFLALALNPPVSALARRLPGHSRLLATALSYIFVLTILGLFVYVALPPIVEQTTHFVDSLPHYVQQLSARQGPVADLVNRYGLQDQLTQLVEGARQQTANIAQGIGNSLITGVTSVFNGFLTLITVLVLSFLMLLEGPRWLNELWRLYTDMAKLERHRGLATKMYKVVSSFVNGQVLVAAIAGAAGLATLLLLTYFFDVPVAAVIPLTGVIFLADLVPMIGATIGAIIVALVLIFNDIGAAIAFIIYFIVYQQIENNFIQPMVQSRTVALSALSVFIAVIIGIGMLGLAGGIVAIPVAGCLRVIVLDYMAHRHRHSATAKVATKKA